MKKTKITEIKSITIELLPDGSRFRMLINDTARNDDTQYDFKIPVNNALHCARSLTRVANNFWETLDKTIMNESLNKENQSYESNRKV